MEGFRGVTTDEACASLTNLTPKQACYIGVKAEGLFKDERYRY